MTGTHFFSFFYCQVPLVPPVTEVSASTQTPGFWHFKV